MKKNILSYSNPKNKKLIGSPGNKNNKKSNFRKRILKNAIHIEIFIIAKLK